MKINKHFNFFALRIKSLQIFPSVLLISFFISCEEFVEVDAPRTSLIGETVFEEDVTAEAAVVGIYAQMMENASTMFTSEANISILTGMSSDEFITYSSSQDFIDVNENDVLVENGIMQARWNDFYAFIYSCNSVLEGLQSSVNITDSLAHQFEGEAKFVRAWMYFYLVNFWGGVPLVLTTDYQANALLPRTEESIVYDQIIADLQSAFELLPEEYPSLLRIRPNRAVAASLLSRVYLYRQDWSNAESFSSAVIEDSRYAIEENPDNVFLNTSQEAIWQLQSINRDVASYDALRFVLTRRPTRGVSFRPDFVDAFEENDLRQMSWIGTVTSGSEIFYFPFKFKTRFLNDGENSNEYLTVFRLAELYLIRAEARAQLGNIAGAQDDLNVLRIRAELTETVAADQGGLLLAIEQERKLELFAELGHRWFDLKRTGRVSDLLVPLKPEWQDTDVLYPIPVQEFLNNPNLGNQNLGY